MRALLGLAVLLLALPLASGTQVSTASTFQGAGGYHWCCVGAPDAPTAWLCEANAQGRTLTGTLTLAMWHDPAHGMLHATFTATEGARTCTEARSCVAFTDGIAWFGPCVVGAGSAWFRLTPDGQGGWSFTESYWPDGYGGTETMTGNVSLVAEGAARITPLPPLPL
ncbi:MAG: hypothetical protein LC624_01705 [Halobacteriales archaeon]|nr:hypothetical protein [Halobacteriales archaeon]